MLRRRDIKTEEDQNQEQKSEEQARSSSQASSTGASSNSSQGGLAWKPMRQTNEEWKPERSGIADGEESIVGPDDFFNGAYKSQRGVRVQGRVEGSIESKKHILIEEQAQVMADMTAEDIMVAGRFNGKVDCRRRFEITPSGVVTGEINTDLLVVQEGGYFDGKLKMRDRSSSSRGTGPSASPSANSRQTPVSQKSDEEQQPSQV